MEVRRVDLTNWALWTSPKFATGVKYQFHQGFWPDKRSGNPNYPSSLSYVIEFIFFYPMAHQLTLLVPQAWWFSLLWSAEKCQALYNLSLSGSWKHPHKYKRKIKAFIFQVLPCLLKAVIKINTVYSWSALAILRDETELALGTKRVNLSGQLNDILRWAFIVRIVSM